MDNRITVGKETEARRMSQSRKLSVVTEAGALST